MTTGVKEDIYATQERHSSATEFYAQKIPPSERRLRLRLPALHVYLVHLLGVIAKGIGTMDGVIHHRLLSVTRDGSLDQAARCNAQTPLNGLKHFRGQTNHSASVFSCAGKRS